VCCVFVPAPMTWRQGCYFNRDLFFWRHFAQSMIGST
jgi:hypothetical protein